MKKRINHGLALILGTVLVTSPVLTFAAGSNRSKVILPPKSPALGCECSLKCAKEVSSRQRPSRVVDVGKRVEDFVD